MGNQPLTFYLTFINQQLWIHNGTHTHIIHMILLMEEILHHLGCINLVNNGISYLSTGAGIQPSTVCLKNLTATPTLGSLD